MTEQAEDRAQLRIAVCIPTRGAFDYKTAQSLAEMTAMAGATIIADKIGDMQLFILPGTYIDKTRIQLAQEAIQWGATHLLWLDDDMVFPPYLLHKLLSANKDIVGVNYPTRKQPVRPVTFKRVPSVTKDFLGERCFTTEESTGLEEVDAIGFGCVLIRSSVFGEVKYPGFLSQYDPELGVWTGEDVYFCKQAREAGLKVYVDHDLSRDIGHVGRMVYQNAHAEQMREFERREQVIVSPGEDALEKLRESVNGTGLVH